MTIAAGNDWRTELGIKDWKPPFFFESIAEIDASGNRVPHAHSLRRAFDRLGLDGVLCLQNSPVAYFKEVDKIDPKKVVTLHRQFWNQGLTPILVLIDPKDVHIYSGLAVPVTASVAETDTNPSLVERLDRIADQARVRLLVLSIESGEFFRSHSKSFDPSQRVDRDLLRNLQATRSALATASVRKIQPEILDALLCRIVFACYLFDRNIIGQSYLASIGISGASHLRDILRKHKTEAQAQLYRLFEQLGADFNGDLFSDDLDEESRQITSKHLEVIDQFLHGTDVMTGQQAFWPYDFEMIPIETISAIYEYFLKAADPDGKRQAGAFYTPRFLAELTLDIALDSVGTLLDKRFLDPACGSGIFLVGLFNRLAEEWKRNNPNTRYDRRANSLIAILRNNILGVDLNSTACRIATFSLYLALLDQLSPPDIQELQRKGKMLPRLLCSSSPKPASEEEGHTIVCGDFFTEQKNVPNNFDVVIGNPPWASLAGPITSSEKWCRDHRFPIPNRQLAIGFIWKSAVHQRTGGRICFVLPHGVLFNHHQKAIEFQKTWLETHAVDVVFNLADMRFNLFQTAVGPALIVRYKKEAPVDYSHSLTYLVPKTSWSISKAEIISVPPEDRIEIKLADIFSDLRKHRAPRLWKERFWGTPRDWKLLDRLSDLPRLCEIVGQQRSRTKSRWIIAEGIQPVGESDSLSEAKNVALPSRLFISAGQIAGRFVLSQRDCEKLSNTNFSARSRSNTNTEVFKAPHVLVSKGLRVAFADFSVAFQHAVRGIGGPHEDRDLLLFLAAYLRSPIARYFLFHESSRWGIERSEVEVAELLRVPFFLPSQGRSVRDAQRLVKAIVKKIDDFFLESHRHFLSDSGSATSELQNACDELLYEYFSIDVIERALIEDTQDVIIPSILPKRASMKVPTLKESSTEYRKQYTELLCETLNDWASEGTYRVNGGVQVSRESGIAAVILHRTKDGVNKHAVTVEQYGLVPVLDHLQRTFKKQLGSIELLRGVKIFERDTLYLFKSVAQRFWTRTAALNDADEIATTILLRSRKRSQ